MRGERVRVIIGRLAEIPHIKRNSTEIPFWIEDQVELRIAVLVKVPVSPFPFPF
jgi:hypothetical protein